MAGGLPVEHAAGLPPRDGRRPQRPTAADQGAGQAPGSGVGTLAPVGLCHPRPGDELRAQPDELQPPHGRPTRGRGGHGGLRNRHRHHRPRLGGPATPGPGRKRLLPLAGRLQQGDRRRSTSARVRCWSTMASTWPKDRGRARRTSTPAAAPGPAMRRPYLDYGFTQPRVISRGPIEQQADAGALPAGVQTDAPAAPAPSSGQPEMVPTPEPQPAPAGPGAGQAGHDVAGRPNRRRRFPPAARPTAAGTRRWRQPAMASEQKPGDGQVIAAGWAAAEKGSYHEPGANPPTAAVDRSAAGWTGVQH